MNNFFTSILFVVILVSGCISGNKTLLAQDGKEESPVQKTNFSDQSTWVLGYLVRSQITRPPHSEWFTKEYEKYAINQEALEKILKINHEGLTFRIVLGTWCPDSRREVPRFMKIIDRWQFPAGNITFVGVDNSKIAPVGGYDTLQIERVPTFIIMQNKVETGRIIENPVTSLEQDMLNILTRNEK